MTKKPLYVIILQQPVSKNIICEYGIFNTLTKTITDVIIIRT